MIGSPAVPKAVVHLSNGKTLTVVAQNLSDKNIYVQSLTVNGRPGPRPSCPTARSRTAASSSSSWAPSRTDNWGVEATVPE